ncbi:MAG TPA: PAS domain-containing protein [Flavisolibacter sp.]|jgi:hypothetical protein|nr:PAS domain-containing protein [Flavisolibacter sp.]
MAVLFHNIEAKFEMHESNVRALFTSAPIPIVIMEGREGYYTLINDMAAKTYSPRNFLGKSIKEAFPDLDEEIIKLINGVYDSGISFYGNEHPVKADWDCNGMPFTRYFNFVYSPYRDSTNQIIGVISMGFDVTEQVETRKKVKQLQGILDAISKASPMSHWVTNKKNQTIFATEMWEKWTNGYMTDSLGEEWTKYILEEDRECFINKFLSSTASKLVFEAEFRLRMPDGSINQFYSKGEPYYNSAGEYEGYSGVTIDLSNLHELL